MVVNLSDDVAAWLRAIVEKNADLHDDIQPLDVCVDLAPRMLELRIIIDSSATPLR